MQNVISCSCSIFNKALEYDFQPIVTSVITIALIMMILMIGMNRSKHVAVYYPTDMYQNGYNVHGIY